MHGLAKTIMVVEERDREVTIGWIEVMFLEDEGSIFIGLDGALKVQLDEVRDFVWKC